MIQCDLKYFNGWFTSLWSFWIFTVLLFPRFYGSKIYAKQLFPQPEFLSFTPSIYKFLATSSGNLISVIQIADLIMQIRQELGISVKFHAPILVNCLETITRLQEENAKLDMDIAAARKRGSFLNLINPLFPFRGY